jgi:hypothetical protein
MNVQNSILLKIFSIFTGLLFLNLSFMLTELKVLGLDQTNPAFFNNLVQMISFSGIEEEADSAAGTTNEIQNDTHLFFQFITTPISSNPLIIACNTFKNTDSNELKCYREIFSPPPEV